MSSLICYHRHIIVIIVVIIINSYIIIVFYDYYHHIYIYMMVGYLYGKTDTQLCVAKQSIYI